MNNFSNSASRGGFRIVSYICSSYAVLAATTAEPMGDNALAKPFDQQAPEVPAQADFSQYLYRAGDKHDNGSEGNKAKTTTAQPVSHAAAPQRHSYLDTGVNAITSHFIADDGQRNTVNHYAGEFLKTAALFTPGKLGLIGTVALQGLAQASPTDALTTQVEDMALGAAKGAAIRGAFKLVGERFSFAPTKGIVLGTSMRAADAVFQRDLFTNPSAVQHRLGKELINPQAWAFDAVVFGAGEGLFAAGNKMTGGLLQSNRILGSMSMGASFGVVSGGVGEITRQQQAGESFNLTEVVKKSLLQGTLDGIAGGVGAKLGEVSVTRARNVAPEPDPTQLKEFIITDGKEALDAFRRNERENALLSVRAVGKDKPIQRLFVGRLDASETQLGAAAAQADLLATCHPENLSAAERAKHVFPETHGRVWLLNRGSNRIALSTENVPITTWRAQGYRDPVRLDFGQTTINVMSPLLVGDPANPHAPESAQEWHRFDADLKAAKELGVDGVSTDVWWGLVEPKKGQYNWSYYDRVAEHINNAGLKWIPILSFHQAGGNVGDTVNVPVPNWIWGEAASRTVSGKPEAVKFVSEQGNASNEFVSFWATPLIIDHYANLMRNFQTHFSPRSRAISEINISLGPSGELRYPSYNQHDKGTGWPTRGAIQAYSELAKESFRDYAVARYGSVEEVGKAWGIADLQRESVLPPTNPNEFFGRRDHMNTQYGRDFYDWYNQSLIEHGREMLGAAVNVFGAQDAPFHGIEIGAKIPGVHWRVGTRTGDSITFSDRLAELNAGLIRTSRNDWFSDDAGRGYRPILSMFKEMQPLVPGRGTKVVPIFTCLEMPDGVDGPQVASLPNSLARWVGKEARRQGLTIRGENALAGNLGSSYNWDVVHSLLDLPNQPGPYSGITFLRMGDVVNNATARAKLAEIIYAIRSIEPQRKPAA